MAVKQIGQSVTMRDKGRKNLSSS